MVDAPEKIWADDDGVWHSHDCSEVLPCIEYVRADIAERENAELRKERDRCHARLEIDHCFKLGDDDNLIRHEIPLNERSSFPDGITARDETIKLVERRAETAERQLAERDAALRPFASAASRFDGPNGKKGVPDRFYILNNLTVGHLRAARAALAGSGDGWRLVPVHLTVEMLHELERGEQDGYRAVWPDVLAASPSTAGER